MGLGVTQGIRYGTKSLPATKAWDNPLRGGVGRGWPMNFKERWGGGKDILTIDALNSRLLYNTTMLPTLRQCKCLQEDRVNPPEQRLHHSEHGYRL